MNNLIKKLNTVKSSFLERSADSLYFFGLIKRTDIEDTWDVLVVADWIETYNSFTEVKFILDNLKVAFGTEMGLFGDVLACPTENTLAKELIQAIDKNGNVKVETENEVKIFKDIYIDILPIYLNIENLEFESNETPDESVEEKIFV